MTTPIPIGRSPSQAPGPISLGLFRFHLATEGASSCLTRFLSRHRSSARRPSPPLACASVCPRPHTARSACSTRSPRVPRCNYPTSAFPSASLPTGPSCMIISRVSGATRRNRPASCRPTLPRRPSCRHAGSGTRSPRLLPNRTKVLLRAVLPPSVVALSTLTLPGSYNYGSKPIRLFQPYQISVYLPIS